MTRQTYLEKRYVEFIPERLDTGIIYISKRFRTASHLCCCGCGLKVVTPLNSAKWMLTDHGHSISLYPSIGNWSFPCKSHYWINKGRIRWAEHMSDSKIAKVREADRLDAELFVNSGRGLRHKVFDIFRKFFGL